MIVWEGESELDVYGDGSVQPVGDTKMKRMEGEVYSVDMENADKKIVCCHRNAKVSVDGYVPSVLLIDVPSWILWLLRAYSQEV